ncbi:hypothetical protein C2845_PM07G14290 [Panicum miliaceum]|uniref:Uncharacterized protein n=1 Tax=Panicum miliaceum TaxID=4540 RepID=A0A3L6SK03_PANMI|nr:hypothetical protein C2845_PM07G14290 [Panicum miliaceum]
MSVPSAHMLGAEGYSEEGFQCSSGSKENLRKTLTEIEKLIDEGEKLLPLLGLTSSGDNINSPPEQRTGSGSLSKTTTSEPPIVFGRDGDTEKIISMLHDTAADHSLIAIHGIPGSGKTTLAQSVCEREKNSGVPYFELIMWIHVTKKFSVPAAYKEMLEIASGQEMGSLSNLDMLQSELKERLKGKRLLLVLDDVWYSESVAEQDDLKKLLSPFKEADKGSRVLLTSRTADAAKPFDVAHHLEPISDMHEEEFFKMFMHYALDNSGVSDQDKGKFYTVGRDISMLLRKSPLAAKTVGGQLKRRTSNAEHIEYWKDIFIQKRDLLKDTMGALWWSYNQLDEHVRQCFAYCSMFPRRYELERDELVQMWMAQGFGDTKRVAGSDCFRTGKDTVGHQIPQDVRHLFIDSDNLGELMEQIVKLSTLRTLVMSISTKNITEKEFERMLKHLKKLRFVHVYLKLQENVIPDCIGELEQLRYLGLYGILSLSRTIKLPLPFTKLYHLQELRVPFDTILHCPHSEMADLENLRRIGLKKEKGYEITQLENLNNIHGRLSIQGLENIKSKEDVRRANLSSKRHVSSQEFVWGSYMTAAVHHQEEPEEILEALNVPALLAELYIWNYDGWTFPSWLSGEDGKLEHLKHLTFLNCHGSGSVFKFSKPLPMLHRLEINTCSWNTLPANIKQLASLEELIIHGCVNIKSPPGLPSSLKKLQITVCKNIKTLPAELPPSLEELCCNRALVDSYPDRQAIDRIKKIYIWWY